MPCASHADYTRLTGDELTTPKQDPRYGQGRDVFESQPEAASRARELDCEGTHTVREAPMATIICLAQVIQFT